MAEQACNVAYRLPKSCCVEMPRNRSASPVERASANPRQRAGPDKGSTTSLLPTVNGKCISARSEIPCPCKPGSMF